MHFIFPETFCQSSVSGCTRIGILHTSLSSCLLDSMPFPLFALFSFFFFLNPVLLEGFQVAWVGGGDFASPGTTDITGQVNTF